MLLYTIELNHDGQSGGEDWSRRDTLGYFIKRDNAIKAATEFAEREGYEYSSKYDHWKQHTSGNYFYCDSYLTVETEETED